MLSNFIRKFQKKQKIEKLVFQYFSLKFSYMEKAIIEQARDVSIVKILDSRGIKPEREVGDVYYYLSPLRVGDTDPSFHVNSLKNRWYDFGLGWGRDSIQLIMELDSVTFPFAVKYLLQFDGGARNYLFEARENSEKISANKKRKEAISNPKTEILRVQAIKHDALKNYLYKRCIPLDLANIYLKEVHFYLRKNERKYFTLGFPSGDGFVTRNEKIPGFVGKNKTISFVPGELSLNNEANDKIFIFEGFFDFLSALVLGKKERFLEDTIILHSVAMSADAKRMIEEKSYQKILLCLDNDMAGKRTVENFKTLQHLEVLDCSEKYSDFKDLNDYLKSEC